MERIKEFISKNKIIVSVLALVVVSFIVYKVAFADEDPYENQITVANTNVSIVDGGGQYDANDDAGNDSGPSNKVVRSFDKITYNIQYDLVYKTDSTLGEGDRPLNNNRSVIVDVLVPNSIGMQVSEAADTNPITSEFSVTSAGTTYNYYKVEIQNASMAQSNNVEIVLSNINGRNNDVISPIIRVREATDDVAHKTITTATDVSSIDKISIDNVRVSAIEKYGVRLYQGVIQKDSENLSSTLPLGIMIYLPSSGNKGIRGIQVPSTVSFNMNVASSNANSKILDNSTISNYTEGGDYVISDLPNSYGADKNGNASIINSSLNQNNNSTFTIQFTNLSFRSDTAVTPISPTESVYYLSTKAFILKNQRLNNNKTDISYTITTNANPSNTIEDYLDNYEAFVGDYTSEIDFFKSSTIPTGSSVQDVEPDFDESGKAIYNYGEEFYMQNTINYGFSKGDKLPNGYTDYVKIDNTMLKLVDIENASDQSIDYYKAFSDGSSHSVSVKYGLGDWTPSNFKLKTNRPSYCPNSINNLSKDDLMNYYGGPCIEENDQIIWVDNIEAARNQNKADKIIIFRFDVLDEYETGVKTTLRMKLVGVNNVSNVGNVGAVMSRGKTTFNGRDYYLSEIPKTSVSDQSQDMKYNKTQYNNQYVITGGNTTTVNGSQASKNIGNSVLISAFKATINSMNVKDAYGSPKTIIHSGVNDPVEFEINPVIYKSDTQASIKSATISVYLPESLEIYQKTGDKAYNEATSGSTTIIDGVTYKVYNYDYTSSDINYSGDSASGTIPILYVHAYVSLSATDNQSNKIITKISGVVNKNGTDYTDVTPEDQRTKDVTITLRNTREINNLGTTDLTRMDKNGTYTYNMRAVNNANEAAELSLLYILPYSGDSVGDGSKFSGTISVALKNALPNGYKAYCTTENAKTILNNEINGATTSWTEWTNSTTAKTGITAIKITAPSSIAKSNYFAGKNGINLIVKTNGNKVKERYFNNFYMIRKNTPVCKITGIGDDDCTETEIKTVAYSSNISEVSVYNKKISGYAYEDSNYNSFYDDTEPLLSNIPVDLYKLSATDFDPNDPVAAISDNDTLVQETTTNADGYYEFEGLESGNYYAKYTLDCDKYTVTEKNKQDETKGDTSNIDSDAQMLPNDNDNKCYAVSNIQTIKNSHVESKHIDIGLRVRQNFDIKMKKYITSVVVNSNKGVQTYNYNNASKVKIDVKNLKNTSFRVTYGIDIENSKYFPGTIGSIIESIPDGMTFNPNLPENSGWEESDGLLYYSNLNKTLIMPGETYHLTIVLDLVTNAGGDYVNFVVANNLQIKPVITSFVEVPEESTTPDESVSQEEEE